MKKPAREPFVGGTEPEGVVVGMDSNQTLMHTKASALLMPICASLIGLRKTICAKR